MLLDAEHTLLAECALTYTAVIGDVNTVCVLSRELSSSLSLMLARQF